MLPGVTVLNQIHRKSREGKRAAVVKREQQCVCGARMCAAIRQILCLCGSALMSEHMRIHSRAHTYTHEHMRALQLIVFKNSSQGAPAGGLPAGHGPESGA